MPHNVDGAVGVQGEHGSKTFEDLLTFRFHGGLSGIEQNMIEDVYGQLALQLGDGDVFRVERRPHFLFKRALGFTDRFALLFRLGELLLQLFHAVLEGLHVRLEAERLGGGLLGGLLACFQGGLRGGEFVAALPH